LNLFRINWHNEPREQGGGHGGERRRVSACLDRRARAYRGSGRQVVSTGAHKVGAAYGCLAPHRAADPTF
jgi:hypothetical protein